MRTALVLGTLSLVLSSGAATEPVAECALAAGYLLDHEDVLEFGVSIHRCPDFWRLELEESRGYAPSGEVQWRVLDALRLRDVAPDEVLVSQTCSESGSPDHGIVAIAKQTDEDDFSAIRAAWRADTVRGRWTRIDAEAVECWNEVAGQT